MVKNHWNCSEKSPEVDDLIVNELLTNMVYRLQCLRIISISFLLGEGHGIILCFCVYLLSKSLNGHRNG